MVKRWPMLRTVILITGTSIGIMGQTFPAPHVPQWWDGGNIVRQVDGAPGKLELVDVKRRTTRTLNVPQGARNLWFSNQVAYAYAKSGKDGILYEAPSLGTWYVAHRFVGSPGSEAPGRLFPLGGDHYLGWNEIGYWDGQKGSYFAVFRLREDGTFTFSGLLNLGFQEALLIKNTDPKPGRPFKSNPKLQRICSTMGASGRFEVLPAEDGVVLAHFWTGRFFFINQKGRLARTVQLYGLSEEELGRYETEVAVLDAQPTREGHILLCARTEIAVKAGPKRFHTQGTLGMYQGGGGDELMKRRTEALRAEPTLRWLKLDTVNGSLEETSTPQGAPGSIWDLPTFQKFRFTLMPDNHVINP